jgi:tRNA dimethylallyltransferase
MKGAESVPMKQNDSAKPTVIAVVGPTASGKSALAIEIALKYMGEVIACDSRTVYKYMDVGTAKPTSEERKGVLHHMLDVVEPDRIYTVAEFQKAGTEAIQSVISQGKLPVVAGGTGLYARALLEGLQIPEVGPQDELRESLKQLARSHGNEALFKKLEDMDPVSAGKIMPNDQLRIIRALEVTITLGKPFSEVTRRVEVPYNVIWVGLNFDDRSVLKDRIALRMNMMMSQGLLDESKFLLEKFGATQPILNAVGYRQMFNYIDGNWTMEEAIEDCLKHNFQLARKQIMWFRANPDTIWFVVDKSKQLFDDVFRKIDPLL